MQESHSAFSAGQHVIVRDERWSIVQHTPGESIGVMTVRGLDQHNRDELQSFLTPIDRIAPVETRSGLRQRSRRAVLTTARRAIASTLPWHECWTAAAAAIELHDWQLEPAIAAASGTMRLLLADGVGLGKTIEAALIVSELRARGLIERVLVLTPASLRAQWATELASRFRLRPVIFDQAALVAAAADLPPDVNPWATASLIISSIDLVKRAEVRAALDATPFDLLIVDEAHHLSAGSDRGAVASDLASRVPWVVLATATPHSGDDEAYAFLTSLGAVGDGPIGVFRRAPSRSGSPRRSRLLLVRPTSEERALFTALADYARALARRRGGGARLVASVLSRRAAASTAAVARTIARRIHLLRQRPIAEAQPPLPWDEVEVVDDEVADAVLQHQGLPDLAREIDWLTHLLSLAQRAQPCSSKLNLVRRLLRRLDEPALIFSEYRDVALQFAAALSDVTHATALHGGLSVRERCAVIDAFTSGSTATLVATDAAGEGLNLQTRCRVVINLELPWTPLRLEQRIGRVDRLGQTRTVHAIHLAHRDSYEGSVIARLERRRARAQVLTATQPAGTTALAADRRRWSTAPVGEETSTVYAPSRRGSRRVTLLVEITLCDHAGGAVQREMLALEPSDSSGTLTRRRMRELLASTHVRRCIAEEAEQRRLAAQRLLNGVCEAIDDRLVRLQEHLARTRAPRQWQASLFDRRDEQAAQRRAEQHAVLDQHLRARRARVRQLEQITVAGWRLVAAWLR